VPLPSTAEARLITVATSITDLVVGDQVGPQDPAQPITHTVIGFPQRTMAAKVGLRDIRVRLRAAADGTETNPATRATNTVYVRRYEAIATITRATGAVDTQRILLRPMTDTLSDSAIVAGYDMQLQPGDTFTIATT
jgi:hypothetical protein